MNAFFGWAFAAEIGKKSLLFRAAPTARVFPGLCFPWGDANLQSNNDLRHGQNFCESYASRTRGYTLRPVFPGDVTQIVPKTSDFARRGRRPARIGEQDDRPQITQICTDL
jgi:hypothetical protein